MSDDNQNPYKDSLSNAGQVLQSLFEDGKSALSQQFIRWKLWNKWSEVVGATIAANTEPVGYQHRVLWVWVKSSTWMQQLIFMKSHIIENINKFAGHQYIKDIRFTMNRREIPNAAESEEVSLNIDKIKKD